MNWKNLRSGENLENGIKTKSNGVNSINNSSICRMYSMVRNNTERRYVTDDRIDIIQDECKHRKDNYDYE